MDGAWHPLVRARWRLRGAWMWPAFVGLALADGFLEHAAPIAGAGQSVVGGIVLGLVVNLACVAVLAWPVGALLRHRRRDLPTAIARNYAGTGLVVLATAGFAAIGIAHTSTVNGEHRALNDAVARAAAYIGDRAPTRFRADAGQLDVYPMVQGSIYRICAPAAHTPRSWYCVVVNRSRPLGQSVVPAGSESNQTMSRGTD